MKRHLVRAAVAMTACVIGLLAATGPAEAAEGQFGFQDQNLKVGQLVDPVDDDCLILSDTDVPIILVTNDTDTVAYLFDNLLCVGGYVDVVSIGAEKQVDPDAGVKTVRFGSPG